MMHTHLAHQDKPSTNFSQVSKNKNYSALYKAIRNYSENPTQYSILMLVADFINSPWGFFKDYKTIAEEVKVAKRTIATEIPKLIKLKFLVVVRKATVHSPHILRLGDAFLNEFGNAKSATLPKPEMQNPHQRDAKSASLDMQNLHTNVLNELHNPNNDDRARTREEIPSSSKPEKIEQPTAEQPVLKDRKLSSKELCDRFKKIIYLNGEPTKWIQFNLFSKVELVAADCKKIIDYAISNHKQIQQVDLNSEEDVLNAILDMQDRMNRKPEKEYNETQLTQTEFDALFANRPRKPEYT
jgi:hypothetical protein